MSNVICYLAVISVVLFANFNTTVLANAIIPHHEDVNEYGEVSDDILEERINNLYSQIDLRFTSEVKKNAVSHFGATGMWQFMKATARHYELQQTSYVDERRDPVKSTEAAADYLNDLYNRFNDWTLAIAAYNCGPGNVRKAMKLAGKSDYWSIRKHLPKETQKYIPRLVAMHYLVNYYYAHNIIPDTPELNLDNIATAKVLNKMTFKTISEQTGIDIDLIEELNPQYVNTCK